MRGERCSALINKLLSAARPTIPPNADNLSQPVDVNFMVRFDYIQSLVTRNQILTVLMSTRLSWYDRALSWDKGDFPVDAVYLQPDEVWRPEIVPYNSLDSMNQFMKLEMKVKVLNNGSVK